MISYEELDRLLHLYGEGLLLTEAWTVLLRERAGRLESDTMLLKQAFERFCDKY